MRLDELGGCGTALVTPFRSDGSVDLDRYRELVDWQIDSGIDFLVPCGTTGESVTLSEPEYRAVVTACVEQAGRRVPVVAGAGTNDTSHACRLARIAEECGANGILSVTPYYNKPTQQGIFLHFEQIARATRLPVVLYNVPGRTGTNILPSTQLRLAELEAFVAVKEASGDLAQIMDVALRRPDGFKLFSGDDNMALAIMALGGNGLISVISNLIPSEMTTLVREAGDGHLGRARQIHYRYLRLMQLMFVESNPLPVKYALSCLGRIEERYRLPLCPMAPESRQRVDDELRRLEMVQP